VGINERRELLMGYYDGDPWSNHVLMEIKCAECEEYFDQQEEEGGNICPPCVIKEREGE
jgi:DNA-directed RNA polymerase subunit RPC12/RpoP